MDSGIILDADKINKEKCNWVDGNNKVYTRRSKTTTTAVVQSDVNPEKQQTLSPVVDVTDDYPVQNQQVVNGLIKPVVIYVDDRVKINLNSIKSKNEIFELRETMRAELNRVQRLSQRLEDKEAELTAFSTVVGVTGNGESYSHSHSHSMYSGDDRVNRRALMRVNSEMGSVGNIDMRPFRQLSVSVVNNNNVELEKRTPKANQYYRNSEFLLGKDRLPPENKRHKSNSGRKPGNHLFKGCNSLLMRLMKHKHGWVFNEPVNAKMLGLHDYHEIIKQPMDLGTVKSRLAQNFYKSPSEFADDVRLTFYNAMTYNPKGQDVHVMAEQLLNIFEERWVVIESESNPDLRYGMIYDAKTPTPTSRKVPHFTDRSESMNLPSVIQQKPTKFAPSSRTPVPKKPKAKDLNKRNMTYEEKQKLSTNLQSLPPEKLDNIVQIIKKKNSPLSQNDEEIEVDIDSVDIDTLWELDRFVTNYKKSLSKHRKKAAELAQRVGNDNPTVLEV